MKEVKLAYKQIGDSSSKTTLVFIHGSTMTKEGMLPVVQGFTKYNCIVFDLRAHGESVGEEPDTITTFAEDIEYSVRELQKKNVVGDKLIALGYSMGGAIVCEIALRKRLKLSGMVLFGSGADLKNYTPLVEQLKEVPIEKFESAGLFSYMFGADTPEADRAQVIQLLNQTKVADKIGYGDLMVSNKYNKLDQCGEIEIPALLVQGGDDQVVLPGAAIETWKAIKDSELLMIPYRGHAVLVEEQSLVTKKVTSFIAKL